MTESAVGRGAGVHNQLLVQRTDSIYLSNTRHPIDSDLFYEFEEEHSHATTHYMHVPYNEKIRQKFCSAPTSVLAGDEATTGKTFPNLSSALPSAGLYNIICFVSVTLMDLSAGALERSMKAGRNLCIENFSKWHWISSNGLCTFKLPDNSAIQLTLFHILSPEDGCWAGLRFTRTFSNIPEVSKTGKILVVDCGGFVWLPFLLSNTLEQSGAKVYFRSTTRSPVAIGHVIHTAIIFQTILQGFDMYAYNVLPDKYDRLLVFSEIPSAHGVRESLNKFLM